MARLFCFAVKTMDLLEAFFRLFRRSLQRRPRIQLGNVPRHLFDEATRIVADYSVSLIYHDKLIGSGTLVSIDQRTGILTAHHVASLINFRDASESLGLCIAEFPHNFQIPTSFLTHWPIGVPKRTAYGPDLSFIEIPDCPQRSQITAKKSFYSLTANAEKKVKEARLNSGFWLVAGCPDELVHDNQPTNDFSQVIAVPGIGACSGVEQRIRRPRFDRIEVGVDYSGQSDSPIYNFGGVSGGGVWRFDLIADTPDLLETIRLGKPYLCGVAFWQSGIQKNRRRLRAHAHRSIYITAVARVRKASLKA